MHEELFIRLSVTVSFLVFVPLFVAFFRRKKLIEVQRKLAYVVIILTIVEVSAYLLWSELINNHFLYHFYSIIEFWLILNIFQCSLKWLNSKVIILVGSAFTLFAIANMIFLQDLSEFNSNVTTTSGVFIVLFSLISFFQLLTKPTQSSVFFEPQFYINSGFLIYFSSNLVLFYLSSRVELSVEESYLIWGAHAIVNCILIIFYTIALWIQPKED